MTNCRSSAGYTNKPLSHPSSTESAYYTSLKHATSQELTRIDTSHSNFKASKSCSTLATNLSKSNSSSKARDAQSTKHQLCQDSRLNLLMNSISDLEENADKFSNSFNSICSQLYHNIQENSLKTEILLNDVVEIKIDLSKGRKDIALLIEMVENSKDNKHDKSTDTDGSQRALSKAPSSCRYKNSGLGEMTSPCGKSRPTGIALLNRN